MDKLKIETYFPVIDRLVAELRQRFPEEMLAFSCLHPRHFSALDGEQKVRLLASRYQLDADSAVSQWRLAHQFITACQYDVVCRHAYCIRTDTGDVC